MFIAQKQIEGNIWRNPDLIHADMEIWKPKALAQNICS